LIFDSTMALLELEPASAGTGIVTTWLCEHFYRFSFVRYRVTHDICRRSTASQLVGHEPHRAVDVPEECPITVTEIVETQLAVRRFDKSVFGAFTITDESHLTPSAVFGQGIELVTAELSLLSGAGQPGHGPLIDIAEKVFWLYKVIARVDIAVVLHGHRRPTSL